MNVGDLYWAELPTRGGRAQIGRRPALILQRRAKLLTVLVVPLTSQLDALRFTATILIEPDQQNGLRRASVALVFQLTAIDSRLIFARLGRVSELVLQEIWSSLDALTGRRPSDIRP